MSFVVWLRCINLLKQKNYRLTNSIPNCFGVSYVIIGNQCKFNGPAK